MRLGEGSGALAAVPLLRLAAAAVTEVATFAEWGLERRPPAPRTAEGLWTAEGAPAAGPLRSPSGGPGTGGRGSGTPSGGSESGGRGSRTSRDDC
jgi:Phosphoribosyltransferase